MSKRITRKNMGADIQILNPRLPKRSRTEDVENKVCDFNVNLEAQKTRDARGFKSKWDLQNQEIQNLKTEIRNLEDSKVADAERIQNLQTLLKSQSQEIDELKNLRAQIEKRETESGELQILLEAQNLKIENFQSEIANLQSQLVDSKKHEKTLNSKVEKLKGQSQNWLKLKAHARHTVEKTVKRKDEKIRKQDQKNKQKFDELKNHYKKKQEVLAREIRKLKKGATSIGDS